jgi:hypothetical protein
MNADWLDALARKLGTAATRRETVKLLMGGVPATVLGISVAHDASAACVKPNKKRRKGKKCCPGTKKKKGRCRCINGGTACGSTCCTAPQVCLPTVSGGLACDIPDQQPGQVCNPEIPASCASGNCGCGPAACTCRVEMCAAAGESCTTNSDCCESLCFALAGLICGPLP